MRFRDRYYPPGGGSGGSGVVDAGVPLDCDYATALAENCSTSGCHSTKNQVAGLALTPDDGLIARIYGVPSTHSEIDCGANGVYQECDWPNEPAACFPFADALLVDPGNPDESWLLKKINGTFGGCGEAMPPSGVALDAAARACLEKFVRAVAAR